VYGILGLAVGLFIKVGASYFLPDYVEIKLSNELVEAELTLLDSQIMQLQQEIQMLSLREEAISQIDGNHRDVYDALISVLRTVPSKVELSRIAIDADAGNVRIEGWGINEVLVSNFLGLLSRNGETRASLLNLTVTDSGGFQFEISIPFDEIL
jgi:Tfp pilus assembly protein PilN